MGWREWVALPSLGVPAIKVKVDTGARTSSLHAYEIERFRRRGKPWVRFRIHPLQRRKDVSLLCEAPVVDERVVSDSGGHREKRIVIRSDLVLGDRTWPIELTLARRDSMMFRMLLGRTALEGRAVVHPGASYKQGRGLGEVYPRRRRKKKKKKAKAPRSDEP